MLLEQAEQPDAFVEKTSPADVVIETISQPTFTDDKCEAARLGWQKVVGVTYIDGVWLRHDHNSGD